MRERGLVVGDVLGIALDLNNLIVELTRSVILDGVEHHGGRRAVGGTVPHAATSSWTDALLEPLFWSPPPIRFSALMKPVVLRDANMARSS